VWGFDEDIIEDIKLEAEAQILDLVFAETPFRQSEFLEIALVEAIECRVKDAIEKHMNSTGGRSVEVVLEPDEDGDDIERPIELIALDYGQSPEEILLRKEQASLRFETLKNAFSREGLPAPGGFHAPLRRRSADPVENRKARPCNPFQGKAPPDRPLACHCQETNASWTRSREYPAETGPPLLTPLCFPPERYGKASGPQCPSGIFMTQAVR